jgi:hypothetical protein
MQLEYLLCYAAAGTKIQFCALKRNDKQRVYRLGQWLDISTQAGLLTCIERTMIISAIICAQRQQLSDSFQLLGYVDERENGVTISYLDSYIEKCGPTVSGDRLDELIHVYNTASGKQCIIQSLEKPYMKRASYIIALEPIGIEMTYAPVSTRLLCLAIRYD